MADKNPEQLASVKELTMPFVWAHEHAKAMSGLEERIKEAADLSRDVSAQAQLPAIQGAVFTISDMVRRLGLALESVMHVHTLNKTLARKLREATQIRFVGAWGVGGHYHTGNVVRHGNCLWICDQDNTKSQPGDDASSWSLAIEGPELTRPRKAR